MGLRLRRRQHHEEREQNQIGVQRSEQSQKGPSSSSLASSIAQMPSLILLEIEYRC